MAALLPAFVLAGCGEIEREERWLGHYHLPGVAEEFPIYLHLSIHGGEVLGNAVDGNLEEATILGVVEERKYELLLHPTKHGDHRGQDVYYRAQRTGDSLVGEWEHVVGATGEWEAELTDLSQAAAESVFAAPCNEATDLDEYQIVSSSALVMSKSATDVPDDCEELGKLNIQVAQEPTVSELSAVSELAAELGANFVVLTEKGDTDLSVGYLCP